jgi:DNA-binding MarR family transcriptional regulator
MALNLKSDEALKLLHEMSLGLVHESSVDGVPDFTVRQLAILLTIYLENPPHTVRGLAKKLGVTKPVITRALDAMGKKDIVTRRRDERDRRNVIISRTVKGSLTVEGLGDLLRDKASAIGA